MEALLGNQQPPSQNPQWVKVFSDPAPVRAELMRGILLAEGIPAIVINRHDSTYTMLGEFELFVAQHDALRSIHIIEQTHFE